MRTESKRRTRTEENLDEIGTEFGHSPRKWLSRVSDRRPGFEDADSLYRGIRNECITFPQSAVAWLFFFPVICRPVASVLQGNAGTGSVESFRPEWSRWLTDAWILVRSNNRNISGLKFRPLGHLIVVNYEFTYLLLWLKLQLYILLNWK